MRVRAEDKKIVKILVTIVAIACASIAVPTVLNESNRAKQDYQQQKSCVDRQMSLLSAENAITSSNTEMIPAGMLEEAKLKLTNEKLQLGDRSRCWPGRRVALHYLCHPLPIIMDQIMGIPTWELMYPFCHHVNQFLRN